MATKIKNNEIQIIESTEHNFLRYPGQCTPQPAFIEIDTDNRIICSDVNADTSNAVPARVWNGTVIRVKICEYLTVDAINELLEIVAPLAAELCDHVETVWDGSNWVGKCDERADELKTEIDTIAREYDGDQFDICTWGEWLDYEDINQLAKYGSFDNMINIITPVPGKTVLTGDPRDAFIDILENLDDDKLSHLPEWMQKMVEDYND